MVCLRAVLRGHSGFAFTCPDSFDETFERQAPNKRNSSLTASFLFTEFEKELDSVKRNGRTKEEKILLLQEERENSQRSQEESGKKEEVDRQLRNLGKHF